MEMYLSSIPDRCQNMDANGEGDMSPAAKQVLDLSPADWDLIIELLKRERIDLPAEIHHTSTPEVRDALRRKLHTLNALLERLGAA